MPEPPMDAMPNDGGEPPMMDGQGNTEMPEGPMDDMGGDQPDMMDGASEENPYDGNFDAGVDADEQTDPKKFIQQLTGKLSQSLRAYNEQQPQPDTDLNKYVAGMITRQAVQNLTPEETQEVIDRIKEDNEPQGDNSTVPDDGDMSQDDGQMMGGEEDPQNGDQQMPMEGVQRIGQRISELFQDLTQPKDPDKQVSVSIHPQQRKSYRNKPFTAPTFH